MLTIIVNARSYGLQALKTLDSFSQNLDCPSSITGHTMYVLVRSMLASVGLISLERVISLYIIGTIIFLRSSISCVLAVCISKSHQGLARKSGDSTRMAFRFTLRSFQVNWP